MVQEATMIVVDDSDYMRNGDYKPTRSQAQASAVRFICQSKRQQHSENTCGLLSMSKPELLMTLTTDMNAIYIKAQSVQPSDSATKNMLSQKYDCNTPLIRFVPSIRIAHLGLRHRQAKNQRMRIVVFVGSLIGEDEATLVKLGKRLKKEKVNIDIVNFGEVDENSTKLSALIQTVNGDKTPGSSHLVSIPPGASLGDSLLSSSIIMGEDGSGAVTDTNGGMDADDPDLLLALRVSMEEQRQRQELARRNQSSQLVHSADTIGTAPEVAVAEPTSEETMLQRALAMSMCAETEAAETPTAVDTPQRPVDFDAMTEDEQIAYALAMSMQEAASTNAPSAEGSGGTPTSEPQTAPTSQTDVNDPSFLREVMTDLDLPKTEIDMLLGEEERADKEAGNDGTELGAAADTDQKKDEKMDKD